MSAHILSVYIFACWLPSWRDVKSVYFSKANTIILNDSLRVSSFSKMAKKRTSIIQILFVIEEMELNCTTHNFHPQKFQPHLCHAYLHTKCGQTVDVNRCLSCNYTHCNELQFITGNREPKRRVMLGLRHMSATADSPTALCPVHKDRAAGGEEALSADAHSARQLTVTAGEIIT